MESYDWAIKAYAEGAVFAAFDLETTGLDPRLDRIAEIGALRFDRQGVLDRYQTLVDPGFPMPAEAGRVNGISDAMLAGQPLIVEALPGFLGFVNDAVILAHNAPFDCGFINEALSRLYDDGYTRFSALPNKIVDTLPLARRLFPGRNRYNLQDLAKDLGIRAEAAHRAFDDARLCMEIFTTCCKAAAI